MGSFGFKFISADQIAGRKLSLLFAILIAWIQLCPYLQQSRTKMTTTGRRGGRIVVDVCLIANQ
jgi:hypothetical protein